MPIRIPALLVLFVLLSLPTAFGNYDDARRLSFYHTHTGESLEVLYYRNGAYSEEALDELSGFLADWRNGQVRAIDPELLDFLWDVEQAAGHESTFEVISAYRSDETNAMLRNTSSGVARNSQHVHGKAIDVRLRGLDTRELRDTALELVRGGVGYYETSDFVHLDTGRVRYW